MEPFAEIRSWFQASPAVAALLLALAPAPGRAGDDPAGKIEIGTVDIQSLLDLSVEAVTRRVERASEAPATVFVLTGEDVRRQGFRTVDELLGSVPGLFAYPGRLPQVGVRGMGILGDFTTRLVVLLDGHPLTNWAGVDVGRGLPLPVAAIERVEVIKGPVGSVYGSSAFFGVVNLVTAGGARGGEAWVGVEGGQGAVNAGEASATWRGRAGAAEVLAAADVFGDRGRDRYYPELAGSPGAPADGVVRRMDFGDAGQGYLRARWRGLTLGGACGHSFAGLPASPVPDRRNALESLTCFAEAAVEGRAARNLELRGRVSFDSFEQRASRQLAPPPAGPGLFQDKGYDRWVSGEVRADWRAAGPLRIDLGSTVQLHRGRLRSSADPLTGIDVVMRRTLETTNSWVLAEVGVGAGLTLHAGLTFFTHSIFGNQLTPKLAAVWQPAPADTVKAIWSRGFRPPTVVEGLLDDRLFFVPDPELKAETVSSLELAYEHRFGRVASATASLFRNDYRDLIHYMTVPAPGLDHPPDPANPADFRQRAYNGGALGVLGGEVALVLRFGDALQAWGGVSVQHADDDAHLDFPAVTGNLALSTRALWRPLALSLRASGAGPRKKEPAALAPGGRTEVPGEVVLSAGAALDVPGVPRLQAGLWVQNVLDARAVSPATGEFHPITELPVAPRTFRADLRYRF